MRLMTIGALLVMTACALLAGGCGQGDQQADGPEDTYPLPFNYVEPELIADGFGFPEGPVFDTEGNVFFVGLGMDVIKKITPEGVVSDHFKTGGYNQSCLFDKDGTLYIAHRNREKDNTEGIYALDPDGTYRAVATEVNGEKLSPNDICWDDKGRLYFSSPFSKSEAKGGVFYIDVDGVCKKFDGDMKFPNGIIHDWEENVLYVSEEGDDRQCIWKYELNDDGSSAGRTKFFQMEDRSIGMDGMKMDVEGNVWMALYGYCQLWCFSPEGEKIRAIPIQGQKPTNLVFTGDDMKTAYVTVNHPRNGKVFKLPMPFAGRPIVPDVTYNF
jgi:gluconolactonase